MVAAGLVAAAEEAEAAVGEVAAVLVVAPPGAKVSLEPRGVRDLLGEG